MDDLAQSERMTLASPAYAVDMMANLGQVTLDWRHKSIPATFHGQSAAEFISSEVGLSQLQTPLLTLDVTAMTHNLKQISAWGSARGVLLAPHGTTTMAPQLWAEQLERGAWGITLANYAQMRVAHAHGIAKVLLPNTLSDPRAIAWVSSVTGDDFKVVSWVDSLQSVDLLESTLAQLAAATGSLPTPLRVMVELGGAVGRTGARSIDAVLDISRAVAASTHLVLVGIGGYEGAPAHSADEAALQTVRDYLVEMLKAHKLILASGHYADGANLILTTGGRASFEDVASMLSSAIDAGTGASGRRVDVLIRSGDYLVHDDRFHRGISHFARQGLAPFRAAMHGWARVVSQPEAGLALLDGGKRDFPFDEGLPEPQAIGCDMGGEMTELVDASIVTQYDQHSFLRFDPATTTVKVGDVVRLGLSHPCTAFDKWTLIPVLADAVEDQRVVSLVHTFF
ncbi:amino acid deaminase [Paeniglutamicibacter sp.]|uniref:amino acid deaminase n=1 Tax=Paeniglutamicibacter sp. TaxID=1934391 RepID=UPI0039894161